MPKPKTKKDPKETSEPTYQSYKRFESYCQKCSCFLGDIFVVYPKELDHEFIAYHDTSRVQGGSSAGSRCSECAASDSHGKVPTGPPVNYPLNEIVKRAKAESQGMTDWLLEDPDGARVSTRVRAGTAATLSRSYAVMQSNRDAPTRLVKLLWELESKRESLPPQARDFLWDWLLSVVLDLSHRGDEIQEIKARLKEMVATVGWPKNAELNVAVEEIASALPPSTFWTGAYWAPLQRLGVDVSKYMEEDEVSPPVQNLGINVSPTVLPGID